MQKRIPDLPETKRELAPSKSIYESDNLGVYIEDLLKNRLTEHQVITIANPAEFIVEGSYWPDSQNTLKLLIHLRKSRTSGFADSFTRTIKKDGISPVFLHLINQFDDPRE